VLQNRQSPHFQRSILKIAIHTGVESLNEIVKFIGAGADFLYLDNLAHRCEVKAVITDITVVDDIKMGTKPYGLRVKKI
jgi:nicotinate-nucleotide pyrophosphorylase